MTRGYFLVMALSSAVTLLRGFIIASIVTLSDFGLYATVVAVGAFGSSLLGAGAIEATMKAFPRAWASGWALQMNDRADRLSKLILARAALIAGVAAAAGLAAGRAEWWVMGLLVAGIAAGTAMMGIYASAIRSTGNLPALGRATLSRSLLALVLAIAGAYWGGGLGAVLGEATAAGLGVLIARHESRKLARAADVHQADSPEVRRLLESATGGRWLLLGMLAVAVPMYLDRLFVVGVLGSDAAGQYGFLMLFVMGAVTVAGIVVQKVGPALVHAHHSGASVRKQWGIAQTWLFGQAALVGVGMAIAALLFLYGPLGWLGQRYQLEGVHFLATAALGALQGAVLLDWVLLSRDQEFRVFLAAAAYVVVVASCAVWLALTTPTLLQVLTCLVIAKLVHVAMQGVLILALPGAQLDQRVGSHESR